MAKIIVHIDLNAFFASAELLRDPSLKGKPVIVSGIGRRSIVSTANYEARKYGIHSAMPTSQAVRLCPHVIIKEPDFRLYKHYSHLFFSYVTTHLSPIIEVASIDECYVDATSSLSSSDNPAATLKKLQNDLLNEIGLPCSIGVGPTKFLAKMASDAKKPLGLTIYRRRDLKQTFWPLPIEKMYGIGKANAPRLVKLGIKTIGDLAVNEAFEVKKQLGKFYFTLTQWANGYGSDEVVVEEEDPKSIGNSQTFNDDTTDYEEISARFIELSKSVSNRAQNEKKLGSTIQIVIRYYDFTTINRSVTFAKPTNNASFIYNEAMKLFEKNHNGQYIRLLGVTLQNLVDQEDIKTQLSLFDEEKQSKTETIIALLNDRLDKPVLKTLKEVKKA